MLRRKTFITVLVVLSALSAAGLWRALPGVDEGQVLVLPDRAVTGPARAWVWPWTTRRSIPEAWDLTAACGPAEVRLGLRLNPEAIGAAGAQLLLADDRSDVPAHPWVVRIIDDLARRFSREAVGYVLSHEGTADLLRIALHREAPPGIELLSLDVRGLPLTPEERSRELAVAGDAGGAVIARVLYIGLDGADWRIIDGLVRRGRLPNFRRILENGVRSRMLSYEPMMSPLLWNTAVTGRSPDAHGIFDFTLADGAGRKAAITSTYRKTAALWEILTAAGQPSAFVNFWASHPAERTDGVLISDLADGLLRKPGRSGSITPSASWPAGYLDRLDGIWTTDDVPVDVVRFYAPSISAAEIEASRQYWSDSENSRPAPTEAGEGERTPPVPFLLQLAASTHNLERIAEDLIRNRSLGVVGVYFGDIDQVGHNFQHLAPPPHALSTREDRARFGEVVANCYRATDAMLGRLLEVAGPETVVLIHSDHGFRWEEDRPQEILPYTRGQPVEWHRLQGAFLATGSGVRRGAAVPDLTLYDVTPTILALRGLPPAADMPGRVRLDLFDRETAARIISRRITSWDALVAERVYPDGSEDVDEATLEAVEELRALGYVGGGAAGEDDAENHETGSDGDLHRQATFYRNKATWLINQDRFMEAEQALLEANRLKPLPKTWSLISETRAAMNDTAGAVQALEEGFSAFPDKMPRSAVLWLVELYLKLGDEQGARDALNRFGESGYGGDVPLAVARGRLAEAGGQIEAAKRAYLEALQTDPREVRAAQRFAALAATPAERSSLEPMIRNGLQLDPRIEIYWQMLGMLLLEAGDPAGASTAFSRAGDLDPGDPDNRIQAANAAMKAGLRDRARGIYEDLAAAEVGVPAVWVNLGSLRAGSGDWDGALTAWFKAKELGAAGPQLEAGIAEGKRRTGR